MKIYTREQIEEIIPHRGRALLLDRVEVHEENNAAFGFLTVREEHCEGHFPGTPIMRGVDRVEMAALTLCVLALAGVEEKVLPLFESCGSIRFSGMVVPGDEIRAAVGITQQDSKRMAGIATLYVGDKIVCEINGIVGVKVSARVLERMRR